MQKISFAMKTGNQSQLLLQFRDLAEIFKFSLVKMLFIREVVWRLSYGNNRILFHFDTQNQYWKLKISKNNCTSTGLWDYGSQNVAKVY